jgi:hypothetical protein
MKIRLLLGTKPFPHLKVFTFSLILLNLGYIYVSFCQYIVKIRLTTFMVLGFAVRVLIVYRLLSCYFLYSNFIFFKGFY